MKYLKKKGDETTIRKVTSDDKAIVLGVVGTTGDLLAAGVLEYCDLNNDAWCFIKKNGVARFGATRDEAVGNGV